MRLSDLLGSELVVMGQGGSGRIHDVRLVQDGPLLGSFGAALRLDGFLAGEGALGVQLGYAHGHVDSPALIARLLATSRRRLTFAGWGDVVGIDQEHVYARAGTKLSEPPSLGTGRSFDAAFSLMDRQLVDKDDRLAGKVDDLSLVFPESGAPYVDAIVSGPGALASRIGGRPGRWLADVERRLSDGPPDPPKISFGVVREIGSEITISLSRDDLDSRFFEAFVRDHIVAKIPGAR
jgi:hypothetical protein